MPRPFFLGSPPPWHSLYDVPLPPSSKPSFDLQNDRKDDIQPPRASIRYPLTPPPTESPPECKPRKIRKMTSASPSFRPSQAHPSTPSTLRARSTASTVQPNALPSTSTQVIDLTADDDDTAGRHPYTGSPIQLRHAPPKGFGLYATRHIERGEEILREKPFITFQHPIESHTLQSSFLNLSDKAKLLFLSFTGNGREKDALLDIAENNAIPCNTGDEALDTGLREICDRGMEEDAEDEEDRGDEGSTSGMFELTCRVNHSCAPNAGWRWCEESRELCECTEPFNNHFPDLTLRYYQYC
jgi:hypothetical protein